MLAARVIENINKIRTGHAFHTTGIVVKGVDDELLGRGDRVVVSMFPVPPHRLERLLCLAAHVRAAPRVAAAVDGGCVVVVEVGHWGL